VNRLLRTQLLVLAAVVTIGAAVWYSSDRQRAAADSAFVEMESGERMLTAMLDLQVGLRGYLQSGSEAFYRSYAQAGREFELALLEAGAGIDSGDAAERGLLAQQEAISRSWQTDADRALAAARAGDGPLSTSDSEALRTALAEFRELNADYLVELRADRDAGQRQAGLVSVVMIAVLALVFGGVGFFGIGRGVSKQQRRQRAKARFADALRFARTESEAYEVLQRHIETSIPHSAATVFNRNNSADRLEVRTPLPADSPLRAPLAQAEPDSCLAIRMGRPFSRSAQGGLIECEVCGLSAAEVSCIPSLVGGEVIGSVLVEHGGIEADEEAELEANVSEAAPVIANVRSLAVAENRAATDGLSGLPNRGAVGETLKRMIAQADRQATPLSLLMLDLDHFKRINDSVGHGKGDEVLAAVGQALNAVTRDEDYPGRFGGEEFVVLLPDTDRAGALVAAEKLRAAIAALEVPGVGMPITASVGAGFYPDDANDPAELLRSADRALYKAKTKGRNRVEVATDDDGDSEWPVSTNGAATTAA
jgi:diguanylate cyclase (GGDEF)-like protein